MSVDSGIARTGIIRVTPSAYVSRIMTGWLGRYGWVAAVVFGICGAIAAIRWEWLVVTLILLLIVYPFILAMVYFRYGLSPEHLVFTRPMKATLTDNALILRIMEKSEGEGEESDNVAQTPSMAKVINFNDIKNVSPLKNALLIRLRTPRYATVFLPDTGWIETEGEAAEISTRAIVEDVLTKNGIKFA